MDVADGGDGEIRFDRSDDGPAPVWTADVDAVASAYRAPVDESDLWQLDRRLMGCMFRGVDFDRLDTVLATGIDVEPPDAVFYASSFDKAWEYGGFPKLLLALDCAVLDRTFRVVPADKPTAELDEVTSRFPHILAREDGQSLWCSRIPVDDPRCASADEMEYAWWIPGDAIETLLAVFVFMPAGSTGEIAP